MRTEIMIVTYAKDFEWVQLTLRTLKKFASGFAGITMVVPYPDREIFQPLAVQYGCSLRWYLVMPGKGFLHHMAVKCEADLWCPVGTEAVAHFDADCIVNMPFTPETLMCEGKPILVREHFEDFRHYPARHGWQDNVVRAIGYKPEWETMVRHPDVFHIDLYRRFRDRVEQVNKMPFSQYVLLNKEDFPMGFCEFPALGGLCLQEDYDRYFWVTAVTTPGPYWADPKWREFGIRPLARGPDGQPTEKDRWHWLWHYGDGHIEDKDLPCPVKYYWSRPGVTPAVRAEIEGFLAS